MSAQGGASAEWATRRERSQVPVVRFMVWLSLLLGRPLSRVVLRGIAVYFLLFSPASRKALQRYYQHLWQRPAGWGQLYRHFLSFATTIHDRVFVLNGQMDLFDIRLEGREALEAELAKGRGLIIMGAHFGSFAMLKAFGDAHQRRAHMLMYEENASKINGILAVINPDAPRHIIALNRVDSMLLARKKLEQGDMLGLLADRGLDDDDVVRLPFLGEEASFPAGPLRLAAMLRCPVFFLAGVYEAGNRYRVHAVPLADFSDCPRGERLQRLQAAQQAYVSELEAQCRAAPHNWFNFFDFWKPSPAKRVQTGQGVTAPDAGS